MYEGKEMRALPYFGLFVLEPEQLGQRQFRRVPVTGQAIQRLNGYGLFDGRDVIGATPVVIEHTRS